MKAETFSRIYRVRWSHYCGALCWANIRPIWGCECKGVGDMRLFLAIALILLFLWLHKSQTNETLHGKPCEAASVSKAVVSFLVSPLSLYSWLSSTLVRLILSTPALVLSCLHHSLLLLLAGPWCLVTVCASLLLTYLHVAVYFLHLALVVGAVAILTLRSAQNG